MNDRVGFIGLGAMGRPMAAHLAAAGMLASVWNRTRSVAKSTASELNCGLADTPAELAAGIDIVVICVSRDQDLVEVIDKLRSGLETGQLVIDCSTVSPLTARDVAEDLADMGVGFVDAPVSGGTEGAVNGTLAVMAGGSDQDFERAGPVLQTFADAIHHMGAVGNGQATKAVNQVMVAGIAEAVTEALMLAEQLSLPLDRVREVTGSGAAGSWFLANRGETLLANDFDLGFQQALLLKDLDIVLALAEEKGLDLPTARAARADYARQVAEGYSAEDISSLIRLKRRLQQE